MKKSAMIAGALLGAALLGMTAQADQVTSYLTGLPVEETIGRERPIAVMFNNIQDGLPQCGIGQADVIYEAEVEGLITRLMGVMEDYENVERIGSVRSARNYYYYLAREWDATFLHFGQAVYVEPLLDLESTMNLSGLSDIGETVYYRSDDRPSPHNVFTDYARIQAGIEELGYPKGYSEGYTGHFQFADSPVTLDGGITAEVVKPGYGYNNAEFVYDAANGEYLRYQYDAEHIDGNTGEQLKVKNIILQYCESVPFDENGYLWTDVVNGGSGYFITGGKAESITWSKPLPQGLTPYLLTLEINDVTLQVYEGDFAVTHYYDESGEEIQLSPGKTWVCVVRNGGADQVQIY